MTTDSLPQVLLGAAHTLSEFETADIEGYHPKGRIPIGFWYPTADLIAYYQRMANGDFGASCQASAPAQLADMLALPAPREHSSTLTSDETDRLVSYLDNECHKRLGYMGYSSCRVCDILNGTEDVDDGTYVWPSGLSHYVKAHNVGLPPEFVAHCLSGGQLPRVETIRRWVAVQRGEDVSGFYDTVGVLKKTPEAVKAHIMWAHRDCDTYVWAWDAAEVVATVVNERISSLHDLGARVPLCEKNERVSG